MTGNVVWDSAGGYDGIRTVFVLHYDAPGKGWRKVKAECVKINEDGAFFGGTIVEATGDYEVGQGAEGWFGPDGDKLGSRQVSSSCPNSLWEGSGTVRSGVVKFH